MRFEWNHDKDLVNQAKHKVSFDTLFPPERRLKKKDTSMSKLTKKQRAEIENLALMADREIDTSDIPETADWRNAVIGKYYRPIKKQVSLRLDADILEWFKIQGGKYQTHINLALRRYMESNQAMK